MIGTACRCLAFHAGSPLISFSARPSTCEWRRASSTCPAKGTESIGNKDVVLVFDAGKCHANAISGAFGPIPKVHTSMYIIYDENSLAARKRIRGVSSLAGGSEFCDSAKDSDE